MKKQDVIIKVGDFEYSINDIVRIANENEKLKEDLSNARKSNRRLKDKIASMRQVLLEDE